MTIKPFELVIFDCDGVLVESEPLANQVFVQILSEEGHHVSQADYLREFFGASLPARLEGASKKLNWAPPADFMDRFNDRLSALSVHELKPVIGIHELIESLTVPICVASNGSRAEIVLRLKLANLTQYFGDAIFSGLEVPHPKPAPDVFLAAASSFNLRPSKCMVIEDSVLGVSAAVAAGMRVYGRAAFSSSDSLRAAGAIPFKDMDELKNILSAVG